MFLVKNEAIDDREIVLACDLRKGRSDLLFGRDGRFSGFFLRGER